MKPFATYINIVLVLVLVAAFAGQASAISDCERADVIRKHVADSPKMPDEVKNELLKQASGMCPKKADVADALKKGDELIAQGKYADALKEFQTALKTGDKSTCNQVFSIAKTLKQQKKDNWAQAFFGAGLSVCDDDQVLKEYTQLAQKAPDLAAKGSENLIQKETIVRSLLERSDRRDEETDFSADISPRPRHEREERWERYPRERRRSWYDDEDAPSQTFRGILFESGSATLTQGSRRQLDILGEALESSRLRRVRHLFVDGHTDSLGSDEANCDLAYRRAKAVIRYLETNWDLEPGRLMPRSFGEFYPVASNVDEEGRRLNRRVVVKNGDMVRRRADYGGMRCRLSYE